MSDNDLVRELLKKKADARRDPQFYEAQTELTHKLSWGEAMHSQGRLSRADLDEFRSHLVGEYLDKMPTEQFVQMTRDGTYSDLETLAGHDGTRDGYSVKKDREALNKRVVQAALDEAKSRNIINDQDYLVENRNLGGHAEEEVQKLNDAAESHDTAWGPADDILFERLLPEDDKAPTEAPAAHPDTIKSADED